MYSIVGVACGFVAFLIDFLVEAMILLKWQLSQVFMEQSIHISMLIFVSLSILFAAVSSSLVVYLGPGALGSGIPELMAYLNGINYPKFINNTTLTVKIFALSLSVAAGLCVGKEGPLAHIGAVIGIAVLYLPFEFMSKFKTES